jgi:DNA-binding HxlR family transcriptional regulator
MQRHVPRQAIEEEARRTSRVDDPGTERKRRSRERKPALASKPTLASVQESPAVTARADRHARGRTPTPKKATLPKRANVESHSATRNEKSDASATAQTTLAMGLAHLGGSWGILILREALCGATRYSQFKESLHIASNVLSAHLGLLVRAGILERRSRGPKSTRQEYIPTELGRNFLPVIVSLARWAEFYSAKSRHLEAPRLVRQRRSWATENLKN